MEWRWHLKIFVPTNFDIKESDYFSSAVDDIIFYGRNTYDEAGSVSDLYLKNNIALDFSEIKKFISYVKKSSKSFFYLMDAVCLDNTEIQRQTHFKLVELIKKIRDAGADGVIVSSLTLMQMVKSHCPELKTVISYALKVDAYQNIDFLKTYGADGIIFSFTMSRDTDFLKMALAEISNDYCFIYLNTGCLIKSINCVRHLSELSHFSQNFIKHKTQAYDMGGILCAIEKLEEPHRHISSAFVTPERAVEMRGEFPGLNFFISDSDGTFPSVRHVFDSYFRKKRANIFTIIKNYICLKNINLRSLVMKPESVSGFYGENRIAYSGRCAYLLCNECGRCRKYFEEHVVFDEAERLKILQELKKIEADFAV